MADQKRMHSQNFEEDIILSKIMNKINLNYFYLVGNV